MNKSRKLKINIIIQIILFFVLLIIDQLTKRIASGSLKGTGDVSVIGDAIVFRYIENTGAAFGIFKNSMIFFYIITIVVFILIIFIWIRNNISAKKYAAFNNFDPSEFRQKTFNNSIFLGYILSALAAGAIGNFIDRLVNQYVVDFIYFKFMNFAVFNFADICVTVSVILIVIFFIFIYKEDPNFSLFSKKNRNSEN